MKIGVPKEIKTHEYRVGLTPGAVREYVVAGHGVIVETDAGAGVGATDDDYRRAGATILDSARDVFASSDMIVKVKEPQPSEWTLLRENQILFTYLHLAPDPEQAKGLLTSGCTAVAYETVTDAHGGLPLLAPMSEVAGRLAIEAAGAALRRHAGGRGLLLGGVPGVQPARVVVLVSGSGTLLQAMLDAERALAQAGVAVGLVPQPAATRMRSGGPRRACPLPPLRGGVVAAGSACTRLTQDYLVEGHRAGDPFYSDDRTV